MYSSRHRVGETCPPPREPCSTVRRRIPPDLVVDHGTSAVESSSSLDFLSLHAMWTPFGGLISYKIMSTISVGYYFTTKSGGIWKLPLERAVGHAAPLAQQ